MLVEESVLVLLKSFQSVPLLDAERCHQRFVDLALGQQRPVVVHEVVESNAVIPVFRNSELVADVCQLELLFSLHKYLQVCFVLL